MFKLIRKQLSLVLMCSIIVLFNMGPTFAAPEDYTLVDDVQSRQVVQPGGEATFIFTVPDPDQRAIHVRSTDSAVISKLEPIGNDYFQKYIGLNSGISNPSNLYGCHFIPYVQYMLTVTPVDASRPVTIMVDMNKGGPSTLVNVGSQDVIEKNMTSGGQREFFSLGFESSGLYAISVSFSGDAYAVYTDSTDSNNSQSWNLSNSSHTFMVNVNAASCYSNTYSLGIVNNNLPGQGSGYSVTIRKMY
ncbi:hypothetical protein [Fusibacter ferrireducens]|uniref:Secreted protein n=1 Tax=Fusibacter ferrireducens TaxID=2785058 RepID=A0ABR9ZU56_9FIRM|nr:hypothetical protein [Fusibacter ferrireducens]MBF4693109.1 hypothetical protein [Fusibacter ferrireducens]